MLNVYVNFRIAFLGNTMSTLELSFYLHFVRKGERQKDVTAI